MLKISQLLKKGKDTPQILVIESLDNQKIEAGPLSRREWGEVEEIEAELMGDIENIQKEVDTPQTQRKIPKRLKGKKLPKKLRNKEMRSELRMKMNLLNQVVKSREAQTHAIFLSLSKFDLELKEEDIEDVFNLEQFNEVYDKVLEISGIPRNQDESDELEEDLKKFPEDK